MFDPTAMTAQSQPAAQAPQAGGFGAFGDGAPPPMMNPQAMGGAPPGPGGPRGQAQQQQQPGFPQQPGFAAAPMAGQQQFQSLEGTFGQLTITGFNPASLNPDALPRPTTAEASTDVSKVQPASRMDAVNANEKFVRMTTNFLPNSASVRNMWKLPIGELISLSPSLAPRLLSSSCCLFVVSEGGARTHTTPPHHTVE